MINLKELKASRIIKPLKVVLYGQEKVGKSSFAANAPSPIFIDTEKGTHYIDCFRLEPDNYADFGNCIESIVNQEHDFKTLIIDSVDWLENMIFEKVAEEEKVDHIEKIGYGRGYKIATKKWRQLLLNLDYIWDSMGMNIILIGHTKVKTFKNPAGDDYDRYAVKLREDAEALINEWAECIMFADKVVMTEKVNEAFGKSENKAKQSPEKRVLYTGGNPSIVCGNRYNLPRTIPLDWDAFYKAYQEGIAI